MKKLLFVLLATGFAVTSFAVAPQPYTLGVTFSFRISGVGNGIMTAYDELGTPSVAQSTSGGATAESPASTAWFKPGKEYTVNFQASGPWQYFLSFTAPDGYQVFVDGVPVDLYWYAPGGGWYSHDHVVMLKPATGGNRMDAGTFSGINIGKAIGFDVGLGGLRSGHSAGLISFREQDLSTSPSSRDRLIYSAPVNLPTGTVRVVRDGTYGQTLRQVGVPQVVTDIVDDGSGGYTFNFYAPSAATWGGSSYSFTGSPWRTIHVQSPGTSKLKVTETEGTKSRVSLLELTSGSVPSGNFVWTLQEGDGSTWLRATKHTSVYNGDHSRDDTVVVKTGSDASGTVVSKARYHYISPGTVSTGTTNTISYNTTDCPLTVAPGASFSFNVNVTNTGTNAWSSNHYVALRDSSYTNLSFASTNGIAPTGSTTVSLNLTAPSTAGVYTYYLQGLENGVMWFATTATLTLHVATGSTGTTDTANYNSTTFPLSVLPGASLNFTTDVTNTGTNTWNSNHYLVLEDWTYANIAFANMPGIAPAGSTTGTLPLSAPTTTGVYAYYLRMVDNGVTWFPTYAPLSLTVLGSGWGEELAQVVADPDGDALTTTYTYYTDQAYPGNYRKVRSITDPTGNWSAFAYYDDWDHRGRLQYEFHPFNDSPSTAASFSTTTGRVVYYEYAPDWTGRYTRTSLRQEAINNVVTAKQTWSYDNSTDPGWARDKADVASYRDTTNYHADRSESIRADSPEEAGEPAKAKGANLVQTVWSRLPGNYSSGTFTYSSTGTNWRELVVHGSTSSTGATSETTYDSQIFDATYVLPNQSTIDVTIRDAAGNVIRKELRVYVGSGTWTLVNFETYTYDFAGRLTQHAANNGTLLDNYYTDGQLSSSVDAAGTETDFNYDLVWRVHQSIKKGASISGYTAQGDITTTFTYDGCDHTKNTDVTGGTLTLSSSASYDLAGRCRQSVAPGGYTTTINPSSGGKIVTVTMPGGATKISETYLDGQLKSVSGTGVVAENYSYAVDGSTGNRYCQSYFGGNSSAWTNTYSDWLGRKLDQWRPEWDGNNWATHWYYNGSNQLYKMSQPGVADTLYVYDTLGIMTKQGLDVNANGVLDAASDDRISQTAYSYVNSTYWYLETSQSVYATSGSGTSTLTGKRRDRLDNSTGYLSDTQVWDRYGNVTHQTTTVNRGNKVVTQTTTLPDSTTQDVRVAYNGRTVSGTDQYNITTTFGYDALGRQTTTTDPRKGTTTTAYVSGTSQVYTVTDPASVVQATYSYDGAGRVATVKNALNKTSHYEYTSRNEKYHVWGETEYPVEYSYDGSGHMTSMSTYRGATGLSAAAWTGVAPGTADTTHWAYNAATNLLSSKTDAGGNAVVYTYTVPRQIYTRAWARYVSGTSGPKVTATYGYSSYTGELTSVSYNDSITSSLSYTYNRLGNQATVTDASGTRTLNYNLAGTLELQSEDLPSYFNSRRITYPIATSGVIGRASGLQLGTSGSPTANQSVTYGYDSFGRFNNVTGNGSGYTSYGFDYTYTPNASNLVYQITQSSSGYTDTRTYDAAHDWVGERKTTVGSANKARFVYTPDILGRTQNIAKTGELFNRYGNGTDGLWTHIGYDDLSQVKSEVTYLDASLTTVLTGRNNSNFSYDTIGNRTATTHNGNTASYTPNNLNQYVSRDVPGVFDVAGAASTSATVTVNGSSSGVTRHGQYFFDGFGLSNSSTAYYSSLTVSDGTTSAPVAAFVTKTPELTGTSTYDADGNLLADGRWNYKYDAENRLISMETNSTATGSSPTALPKQKLTFAYDYLNRRVSKVVQSGWTGSSYANTDLSLRFIYNGWNCIAELDNLSSLAIVSHHFWGLDIAGPGQTTGGVGALLMTQQGSASYLPIYDGNGNLHGLINASTGSIDAAYEYDAFGNTIRESGTFAANNFLRYSAKYTDLETGLVYYGMRYYSPSQSRFITKDPIEEKGGLNLYAFCSNNGINNCDVLGNDAFMDIRGNEGGWFQGDGMDGQDRYNAAVASAQPSWEMMAQQSMAEALHGADVAALGKAITAAKVGDRSADAISATKWVATGVLMGDAYISQALSKGYAALTVATAIERGKQIAAMESSFSGTILGSASSSQSSTSISNDSGAGSWGTSIARNIITATEGGGNPSALKLAFTNATHGSFSAWLNSPWGTNVVDNIKEATPLIAAYAKTGGSAIEIYAHGSPGQISLGSDILSGYQIVPKGDPSTFQGVFGFLNFLGTSLPSTGSLEFVSCQAAAGPGGQLLYDNINSFLKPGTKLTMYDTDVYAKHSRLP